MTPHLARLHKGRRFFMDEALHKILDLIWQRKVDEKDFCEAIEINKSAVTDWKKKKTK
jgi:hypothetical protein